MTVQDFTLIAAADPSALPAEPFEARHLIDGAWRASVDGASFERRSPAHGTLVTRAAKGGEADTEAAMPPPGGRSTMGAGRGCPAGHARACCSASPT
jgi:hypothetical protein